MLLFHLSNHARDTMHEMLSASIDETDQSQKKAVKSEAGASSKLSVSSRSTRTGVRNRVTSNENENETVVDENVH